MGNLLYLALAVGLSTVGALVLWAVRHRPRSMQREMDLFSRELRALRPPESQAGRSETHLDQVEPLPIQPRAVSGGTARPSPVPPGPRRPVRSDTNPDRRRSSSES